MNLFTDIRLQTCVQITSNKVDDTLQLKVCKRLPASLTSCACGDTICPRPSPPRGRRSASRAAEQTQRSSTFPRRIRSHADRCSRLTR